MLPSFLATILFSLSAVFGGRASRLLGGVETNFWRLSVATVFLAIYGFGWGLGLGGTAFPWLLLSGLIGFGIGDLALYQALPRIGSRLSILMVNCIAAPVASLIDWLWLDTRLTPLQMVCSATILAGVAVAVAPKKGEGKVTGEFQRGLFFGLLAAIGQAGGAVISRKAILLAKSLDEGLDGGTAAFQRIIAGVILSGFFLLWVKRREIFGGLRKSPSSEIPSRTPFQKVAPWIVGTALAGPTLGVSCYQWALKSQGTGVVLSIVATTPLVVIPFSYWIEGERPTVRSLIGGMIAVAGAIALVQVTH